MGRGLNRSHKMRGGVVLEKDIDYHNQKLWKRKKYREQVAKDAHKKTVKEFRKLKEQEEMKEKEASALVNNKQKEFYDNLFANQSDEEVAQK